MKKHIKNTCRSNSAFTMVEMSVVLVIIGLIMGSIFVAQGLLGSSEAKTLVSDVQKLQIAVGNFQGLYKGMPGDIPNATSYWSGTANGDGNGRIAIETSNEPFRGIQQLQLANLLESSYTGGFSGTWGSGFVIVGTAAGNVISANGRDGAGLYVKCCSGTDYSRTIAFNNHINLFAVNSTITKRSGIVTPIEALSIDQKIDDGVPDTGLVGGEGSWNGSAYVATGCYSSTGSASTYDTAIVPNNNSRGCQMLFAYDWN